MTAYERVQAARAADRPTAMRCIERLFTDFYEMHGDRAYGDDPAMVAGIALFASTPVTVLGIEKGASVEERVRRNFGSAHPEGYRKAMRQMRLAEKFHRPVIAFVDTAGAYCGIGAEERGQGSAIAESLLTLSGLKTPVLSIIIGEGGSGGALGLAIADEVWMFENAVYSVITPEGAASIIWKDASRTEEAAERLRLTAQDMLSLGVIEQIFSEEQGFERVYVELQQEISKFLLRVQDLTPEELTSRRRARFQALGAYAL